MVPAASLEKVQGPAGTLLCAHALHASQIHCPSHPGCLAGCHRRVSMLPGAVDPGVAGCWRRMAFHLDGTGSMAPRVQRCRIGRLGGRCLDSVRSHGAVSRRSPVPCSRRAGSTTQAVLVDHNHHHPAAAIPLPARLASIGGLHARRFAAPSSTARFRSGQCR